MRTEAPKGETAPLQTETLQCAGPGAPHTFEWIRRGGARPKFCERHRRKKSVERSEIAHYQRKAMAEEMRDTGAQTVLATRLLRLACGMRVFGASDLELAAQWGGISERGAELEALALTARRQFPDVIEGAMRSAATAAETMAIMLIVEGFERRKELPAKDFSMLSRSATEIAENIQPDGPTHNYVGFSISVTPCPADGKLTEEQRAILQGRQKPEEPEE